MRANLMVLVVAIFSSLAYSGSIVPTSCDRYCGDYNQCAIGCYNANQRGKEGTSGCRNYTFCLERCERYCFLNLPHKEAERLDTPTEYINTYDAQLETY